MVQEEMLFKEISYLELRLPFCSTICAIFVGGIMRNISMKLFCIWTSDSGKNVI